MRIVICGDEGVGKTSLVASLVRAKSTLINQKVWPPITISRDDYINCISDHNSGSGRDDEIKLSASGLIFPKTDPRNSTFAIASPLAPRHLRRNSKILMHIPQKTVIVDTSSSDVATLQMELKQADVIWLVYSDNYTYERISLHWMPMFRSLGVNLQIILCANKADLMKTRLKAMNDDDFIPLINEFKEIEACVRCSAKTNYNVVEAFYLCQRSIIHPISPLFDSKGGTLKVPAVAALKRVFFLSDKNQDGFLDFEEFAELHVKCFGKEIMAEEFQDILHTINQIIIPATAHAAAGLSEDGFIILNKKYAETGRHETIWGILRAFHYTNSLSLNDRILYPQIDVNVNSSVELSPVGYKFLVDLFLKFDKDNDGGLSDQELSNLFRATPGIPKFWNESQFPSSIVCNDEGFVTLQGWLAQWNLTTFRNHRTTLEYLAYLGFDCASSRQALKIAKPRKRRLKQGVVYRQAINDRSIFNCFILGSPGCGKTSLLDLFLRGTYSESYSPTDRPRMCIKDIELRGGKQCYLVLEELGDMEEQILEDQKRLDQCDVMCYAYDSSDPESFQYLVDLRERYHELLAEIPAVFVALKADLDKQQQRCDIQPENYTREVHLSSPLHISSSWTSSLNELFIQLVDAAKTPSSATAGLEATSPNAEQENRKHLFMAGGALTVMTVVSVWIWRSSMQSHHRTIA